MGPGEAYDFPVYLHVPSVQVSVMAWYWLGPFDMFCTLLCGVFPYHNWACQAQPVLLGKARCFTMFVHCPCIVRAKIFFKIIFARSCVRSPSVRRLLEIVGDWSWACFGCILPSFQEEWCDLAGNTPTTEPQVPGWSLICSSHVSSLTWFQEGQCEHFLEGTDYQSMF